MKYIENYKCYVTQAVFIWSSLSRFPKDKKGLFEEMCEIWPDLQYCSFLGVFRQIKKKGWPLIIDLRQVAVSPETLSLINAMFDRHYSLRGKMSLPKYPKPAPSPGLRVSGKRLSPSLCACR